MKKYIKYLIALALIFNCQVDSYGQVVNENTETNTPKLYKIVKHDGTEYIGEILSDDGREVLIQTKSLGKIYIPKADIKSITPIEDETKIVNNNFRESGPFTTRYHFTTNALPIKKGEDYALVNLYGPEVHFSVSDQFTAGVMTSWIGSPFVGAFKYTIPTSNEKINLGLGTLFGTSGYLNSFRGYGGLYWGMITFGDRLKNFTVSAGFTHVDVGIRSKSFDIPGTYDAVISGGWSYSPQIPRVSRRPNMVTAPVISIGGIVSSGKKASFIFDSMLFFSKQKGDGRIRTENRDPNNPYGPFGLQSVTVEENDKNTILFYMMPGMRFQQTDSRAFQVALAGVTYARDGRVISFPAPTCSWFFQF